MKKTKKGLKMEYNNIRLKVLNAKIHIFFSLFVCLLLLLFFFVCLFLHACMHVYTVCLTYAKVVDTFILIVCVDCSLFRMRSCSMWCGDSKTRTRSCWSNS